MASMGFYAATRLQIRLVRFGLVFCGGFPIAFTIICSLGKRISFKKLGMFGVTAVASG